MSHIQRNGYLQILRRNILETCGYNWKRRLVLTKYDWGNWWTRNVSSRAGLLFDITPTQPTRRMEAIQVGWWWWWFWLNMYTHCSICRLCWVCVAIRWKRRLVLTKYDWGNWSTRNVSSRAGLLFDITPTQPTRRMEAIQVGWWWWWWLNMYTHCSIWRLVLTLDYNRHLKYRLNGYQCCTIPLMYILIQRE